MLPKRAHGNQRSPFEYMFWRKPLAPFQLPDAEDEDEKVILDNLDSDAEGEQEALEKKKASLEKIQDVVLGNARAHIIKEQVASLVRLIVSRPNKKLTTIHGFLEKQILSRLETKFCIVENGTVNLLLVGRVLFLFWKSMVKIHTQLKNKEVSRSKLIKSSSKSLCRDCQERKLPKKPSLLFEICLWKRSSNGWCNLLTISVVVDNNFLLFPMFRYFSVLLHVISMNCFLDTSRNG